MNHKKQTSLVSVAVKTLKGITHIVRKTIELYIVIFQATIVN